MIYWIEQNGWQPNFIGFAKSEKDIKEYCLKHLGYTEKELSHMNTPDKAAVVWTIRGKDDDEIYSILSFLGRDITLEHFSDVAFQATLLHEVVHVWQDVIETMGETEPSKEFEAYSLQFLYLEFAKVISKAFKFEFPEDMK